MSRAEKSLLLAGLCVSAIDQAAEETDFARQDRFNVKTMPSSNSTVSYLPNEVLEHIMGYLNGIPALHAFVEADSQAKLLFHARPRMVLLDAIKNCSMALQIKQLACAVMDVRSQPHAISTLEYLIPYVFLQRDDAAIQELFEVSVFSRESDPIALLEDSANVYRQIAEAEESLVRAQLPKTADRIRRAVDREELSWPIHCPREGRLEKPPSSIECHRIRQALWRLWLYFGIFHNLQRNQKYRSSLENLCAQKSFFRYLTIWELEEIECVYYHLQYQNQSLWRKHCTGCKQYVLPDVMYNGTCKECRGGEKINAWMTKKERKEAPDPASFSYACSWYRKHMHRREPVANYTDTPAANYSNAGFRHLVKCSDPECMTDSYLRNSTLGCFLDWGYCMWDESRFKAWNLVDKANSKLDKDEASCI